MCIFIKKHFVGTNLFMKLTLKSIASGYIALSCIITIFGMEQEKVKSKEHNLIFVPLLNDYFNAILNNTSSDENLADENINKCADLLLSATIRNENNIIQQFQKYTDPTSVRKDRLYHLANALNHAIKNKDNAPLKEKSQLILNSLNDLLPHNLEYAYNIQQSLHYQNHFFITYGTPIVLSSIALFGAYQMYQKKSFTGLLNKKMLLFTLGSATYLTIRGINLVTKINKNSGTIPNLFCKHLNNAPATKITQKFFFDIDQTINYKESVRFDGEEPSWWQKIAWFIW
jgi:hypothetical protein